MKKKPKLFLSHSSVDKETVRSLSEKLKSEGIDVWLDECEIKVGDEIVQKIQDALSESDYLAFWITKNAINSGWVEREWQTKYQEEVNSGKVKVLPLLAEDVTLPKLLQGKSFADFRTDDKFGLSQVLDRIKFDSISLEDCSIQTTLCWESYGWLFNVEGHRIPYIPLMNEVGENLHLLRLNDLEVRKDLNDYPIEELFKSVEIIKPFRQNNACRLSHYYLKDKSHLSVTFSKTTYEAYLRSNEVLDFPITPGCEKTYRDEFGHLVRSGERNLRPFKLSDICGIGLFVLSSDGFIVASKHSLDSHVYPSRLTYSASGIMLWGAAPNPFLAVSIKANEEINHQVNLQELRLIDFGADARKLYFQFSFIDKADIPFNEIQNNCKHELIPIPVDEGDTVIQELLNNVCEPAAEATLILYLMQNHFFSVAELDKYKMKWPEKEMREEWDYRGSLPGLLPDMSVRYPADQLELLSDKYLNHVKEFLGNDVEDKDILEIGCGTGRLTKLIANSVKCLTCLDLSEAMLRLHKMRLSDQQDKISYYHGLAQTYSGKTHDLVICSLVLVHNVYDNLFHDLVDKIASCTDVVFVFEDVTKGRRTGPHTKLRSREEIQQSFRGFRVERDETHLLYKDEIAFMKLVRR